MPKTCDKCGDSYTGFGTTCSACRKMGQQAGSSRQCPGCGVFFNGFGVKCADCAKKDGSNCGVCGKVCYQMERITIEGQNFHPTCFKCRKCSTKLKVTNFARAGPGKFYCKVHYEERVLRGRQSVDSVAAGKQGRMSKASAGGSQGIDREITFRKQIGVRTLPEQEFTDSDEDWEDVQPQDLAQLETLTQKQSESGAVEPARPADEAEADPEVALAEAAIAGSETAGPTVAAAATDEGDAAQGAAVPEPEPRVGDEAAIAGSEIAGPTVAAAATDEGDAAQGAAVPEPEPRVGDEAGEVVSSLATGATVRTSEDQVSRQLSVIANGVPEEGSEEAAARAADGPQKEEGSEEAAARAADGPQKVA